MGPGVKESLYAYFENNYGISRSAIPKQLDEFVLALTKSFGVLGARTLGRAIVKRLYNKLGLTFTEREYYSLIDYVREAKLINRIPPSPHD
jgi:hypothetical protein